MPCLAIHLSASGKESNKPYSYWCFQLIDFDVLQFRMLMFSNMAALSLTGFLRTSKTCVVIIPGNICHLYVRGPNSGGAEFRLQNPTCSVMI